ncbi:MAG: 2-oxo acid dehydrogenase subunit E2 [Phycisphaerae bacterium]|nr:2-oxo acid dehydrogenase subunit E2 [Phycisphaerae bacterium]
MSHHSSASANPNDFILPDLGEGVHEAELLKWRVKVGDSVKEHDILADMETDKAVVEVPSPRTGVIAALHGSEGEILKVGNALVSFVASSGGSAATPTPTPAAVAVAEPKPASTAPCEMGTQIASHAPAENGTHAGAVQREDAGTVVGAVGGTLGGVTAEAGKALATPAVRRLARDLGVDIDRVTGTGIGGRVLEKDIRAASTAPAAAPSRPAPSTPSRPVAPPAAPRPAPVSDDLLARTAAPAAAPQKAALVPPGQETVRVPFRGVRRTIANRLKESVTQTVHFTVMDEADVSALDALRRKLAAASGEKVSFLPFVAAALCRCLSGEFAEFNATTDDAAGEIVRHRAVHMGIATDTDNGLMVPVVRDCDKLGVLEISRHIAHVAVSARNRSAPREMLLGSTFTISNVGSHAGRFATPILNYPEVGILAVGRARDGVVVKHGMLGVGKLLPLSLACDHRVVDGASAALLLARLIELLQAPDQLLGPARA